MATVVRIITRLNRGGPLRQLEALVPRLPAHGYEGPILVGSVESHERDGRADLVASGAQLIDVPSLSRGVHPLRDRHALRELVKQLKRLRPTVVHTHLGKAGLLGRIAASRIGVPCVHTLHGHHFARPGWIGRIARGAERRMGSRTGAWITLSASQRDDLARVVGAKGGARIHVVGPGLDTERFAMAPPGAIERSRLLWTGRFVPVKRLDVLLRAFAAMDASATLSLVGGGPEHARVEAAIAANPRCSEIEMIDEVDDVRPMLASHGVVVLSSDHEGTPLSLLEAMAAGRAVVATRAGGIPDIVESDRTGVLVPCDDAQALARALDGLLGDAPRAAQLGIAAQQAVGVRFGADRLASETAAVYEAVLGAAKG